ncbi:lactate/malate family dehydrogenase [Mesomycoplasma hyorhinis]|uniref:lactate/malate family dehydrogenase n=1 Tax=Mesomycoplasma hyorhinis TaxID=2100 RepID=UPI001C03A426|nr:lactate dehydrogenase [Mesomycoplasma hyorhinis]
MKIAIVGADKVCVGLVNNLILSNDHYEILIIDKFEGPRDGNVLDFEDFSGFASTKFSIKAASYAELKDVDLLIIGAKARAVPGQLEHEFYEENSRIIYEIAYFVKQSGFLGLTILLTQPNAALAKLYTEATEFEAEKIIGFGTMLENLRLHKLLKDKIEHYEFDASVLGDKSDNFANFDEIKEKYKISDQDFLANCLNSTNKKDLDVFVKKGRAHFAASFILFKLINSIYHKKEFFFTANVFVKKYYEFEDNFLSIPAVINLHGVKKVKNLILSKEEQQQLISYQHRLNYLYNKIKKIQF